jgi:hypothetical protein
VVQKFVLELSGSNKEDIRSHDISFGGCSHLSQYLTCNFNLFLCIASYDHKRLARMEGGAYGME